MRIIGIDADSHKVAAVCFENGKLKEKAIFISKAKVTQDRVFDLYHLCESGVIKGMHPDKVYIEDSIYVQSFYATKSITEVIANIKLLCRLNQIPFETVPIRSWKKKVLGTGKATKADVKQFVVAKYPEFGKELQDLADALCVCMYGVQKHREETQESEI